MSYKRVLSMSQPVLHCSLPSMTRQEFRHDADMNVIVDRFLRTGVLDQPNAGRPCVDGLDMPGDFTEASNLAHEQLHQQELEQNSDADLQNATNNENGVSENDSQRNSGDDQQDSSSGVERPVQ